MKVILYMALSLDGFIATKGGDSEWVSEMDLEIFNGKIKKTGCIAMGRKTFDQYYGEVFPKKEALNIVLTSREAVQKDKGVIFVNSPFEAVKKAQEAGFNELLLIGGGTANGSFLRENLIDEIYVDVHLLLLGEGIKIFENIERKVSLEMIDTEKLSNGQTLLHYKILK